MGEQREAFEATLSALRLSPEQETLLRDVAAGRTTLTPLTAAAAGIPDEAYEAALRAMEEHAAARATPERRDGEQGDAAEPTAEQ